MLRQFEKEKEKANGESSLGSSPSSSSEKSENINFYENLSRLMSERNKIRLQMREIQAQCEKTVNVDPTTTRIMHSRYEHLKNEMNYLYEDINAIVTVVTSKNDTKFADKNEESLFDKFQI